MLEFQDRKKKSVTFCNLREIFSQVTLSQSLKAGPGMAWYAEHMA